MLKFHSRLISPTLFTAAPAGAGRSLDVTKILFEDSHTVIIPILPNTITCTYTQGQKEWIKNPNQNQAGNTTVCSSFGMGVNQHRRASQT